MVNRDDVKEVLLSKNPEFKILYNEDEIEDIIDGVCKDIEYIRKTIKEVNMLIVMYEKSNPEIAKQLIDKYYNFDIDEIW